MLKEDEYGKTITELVELAETMTLLLRKQHAEIESLQARCSGLEAFAAHMQSLAYGEDYCGCRACDVAKSATQALVSGKPLRIAVGKDRRTVVVIAAERVAEWAPNGYIDLYPVKGEKRHGSN